MASREEFAAFALAGQQSPGNGWQHQQSNPSPPKSRPPQSRPKTGESAPLLPPMPQSALPKDFRLPPPSSSSGRPSRPKRHGRSRSEFILAPGMTPPLQGDPSHPFNAQGGAPPVAPPGGKRGPNRPPRAGAPQSSMVPPPPPPGEFMSPLSFGGSPPVGSGAPTGRKVPHRRVKSEIPFNLIGGDGGSVGGGRLITKADLLKNLPSPRWGGAPKPIHSRNRSGSDGRLLSDEGSVSSGRGYGAISSANNSVCRLESIGNVELPGGGKGRGRHIRAMSDASALSVTTDMAKSALFKGVTDTGRIRLQLPKDSFRILMDSSLEAGWVYKRKLVDNEDEYFVEFHTVDEDGGPEGEKRLPPDLYVMAVDGTIYRRMLDEVIASRTMPCGTFFCGHHEDVRHPDITIAAIIVSIVFCVLLAGTMFA